MVTELDQSIDDIGLELAAERDQQAATNQQNTDIAQQNGSTEVAATGDAQNQQAANTAAASTGTAATETAKTTEEIIGDPDDWYNKQQVATETTTTATQTQIGQKTPEADPVYEKYKTALNDPQVQFLLDQRLAGKSLFDIQKEITIVDYDKMSPADLMKAKMERYGATPEDIIDALEVFNQKKFHEQNEEVEGTRERLKSAQDAKMKALNQTAQQSQEQQIQFQQKINSEIQSTIESLKGKDFFGRQISEDAISRALPMVQNGMPGWVRSDGSPNIQQIFEDIIFLNERTAIVKEAIKRAAAKGARDVATEIVNGSKNLVTDTGSARQASMSIEQEAADMDAADEKRYGRTG